MAIQRLAIVGTGLIGASVGLAAKRAGVAGIRGFDPDPAALQLAHERGAIDHVAASLADAPDAHDRIVALTSHLPHALANLLISQGGATRIDGHDPLDAAGGSLRDMTRVAGANPRVWVDIFLDNADAVRDALAEHRRRVEQLEHALETRDAGYLARWIAEAASNRRRMLAEAYTAEP